MKKKTNTNMDAIKAMRKGGREAEQELYGPGFHSFNKTYKDKTIYTRKTKHKGKGDSDESSLFFIFIYEAIEYIYK